MACGFPGTSGNRPWRHIHRAERDFSCDGLNDWIQCEVYVASDALHVSRGGDGPAVERGDGVSVAPQTKE